MLEVLDLGVRLGEGATRRWILRHVALTVRCRETVALLGPSGSGKSTLLNLLGGLTVPDEGAIRLTLNDADGGRREVAVHALTEAERVAYRRRHIGFVFQFFNLVPTLTVAENVLLPLELNQRPDLADAALQRLDDLGIGALGDRFPNELSGGEQQRAAVARALAHRPPLLLADEPTGNLDAANAERVVACLWEAAHRAGAALVLATHSERVAQQADTVVALR